MIASTTDEAPRLAEALGERALVRQRWRNLQREKAEAVAQAKRKEAETARKALQAANALERWPITCPMCSQAPGQDCTSLRGVRVGGGHTDRQLAKAALNETTQEEERNGPQTLRRRTRTRPNASLG